MPLISLRVLLPATLGVVALGVLAVISEPAHAAEECAIPEGFSGRPDANGELPPVRGCDWKYDRKERAWILVPAPAPPLEAIHSDQPIPLDPIWDPGLPVEHPDRDSTVPD